MNAVHKIRSENKSKQSQQVGFLTRQDVWPEISAVAKKVAGFWLESAKPLETRHSEKKVDDAVNFHCPLLNPSIQQLFL